MSFLLNCVFPLLVLLNAQAPISEQCRYPAKTGSMSWKELDPGIYYGQWVHRDKGLPKVYAHVLKIQMDAGYAFRALRTQNGGLKFEDILSRFEQAGSKVAAALNGDYFSFLERVKDPLGLFVMKGQVLRYPANTSSLVQDEAGFMNVGRFTLEQWLQVPGARVKVEAANEAPGANSLVVYSGLYVKNVGAVRNCLGLLVKRDRLDPMVNRTLALQVSVAGWNRGRVELAEPDLLFMACGSKAAAFSGVETGSTVYLETTVPGIQHSIMEAVSGGPRVLRGGKAADEIRSEGFSLALKFYIPGSHPRSAAGISPDGRTLFLLAVEGRGISRSSGLSSVDTGCLLLDVGASDGLLFDGGGSAVLYGGGGFLNKPHAGRKFTFRDLANALGVVRLEKK